jgi:hypothetical protein
MKKTQTHQQTLHRAMPSKVKKWLYSLKKENLQQNSLM